MANAELRLLLPDAPQALCAILDSAQGAVQPPIRSEIFGPQRFAQHGRSLGETHRAARARIDVLLERLPTGQGSNGAAE